MLSNSVEINICLILTCSVGILYLLNGFVINGDIIRNVNDDYGWFLRLSINIFSYSTIFVPGYLVYKYAKSSEYLKKSGNGCFSKFIRFCLGDENDDGQNSLPSPPKTLQHRTAMQEAALLVLCFIGLQGSYLTWGVLQERVMTHEYVNNNNEKSHFKDSQFLVFVNRILAFCIAGLVLLFTKQPRHTTPLYKYVYCSLSNILSSWCQYEALKYVTFPHQVLAKAGKVIPVMIMSKIVSRTKYEYYEYVTAVVLSLGMVFFLLDTGNENKGSSVTTLSGFILLISYILFDSFTSNWQSALFEHYGMSSVQMMCVVNLFSCMFTITSLLQQGGLIASISFMYQFPMFVLDCVLLSVCSAVGQLIIFFTISTFGAVVFTIIMTIRQGLAILLSCLIYNHHISWIGISGICLVFLAVFLRIYCNQRLRLIKKRTQAPRVSKV